MHSAAGRLDADFPCARACGLEPRLKRRFYEATQVGFCAAAAAEVALQDYLQQYGACMTRLLKALDADRYRAELPTWECMPFETRCAYCRKRAATGFTRSPDGDLMPICPACDAKRDKGDADERRTAGENSCAMRASRTGGSFSPSPVKPSQAG